MSGPSSFFQLLRSGGSGTYYIFLIALAVLVLWMARAQLSFDDPMKLKQLVTSGAQLIDVRSPGEYAKGHIEGAINIPVGELTQQISQLGDPQKPIVVYCRSGVRSSRAQSTLRAQGFTQVYNLGGINEWPK